MIGEQPTLWAAVPAELLALPEELARMDTLPDDPAFFVPLATFFESTMLGRRFRAGGSASRPAYGPRDRAAASRTVALEES
jgi:hypothetical protein